MGRGRWSRFALLAGVLAALAGGATAAGSVGRDAHQAENAPLRVGVVYSRTGLLAAYGAEYVEGLKIGLDYATNGTDAVNGHKALLGGKGHKGSKILVPLSANDFTPFAQQAKDSGADLIFVAWAGSTAPAMWKALQQQSVFGGSTKVVTGLAEKATWPTFGPVASDISFLSHYVWTAPKNAVNDYLVKRLAKRGQTPDLFTPDGFVAA